MTKSGIYQILCGVSGKRYVGSAVNLSARWSVHKHLLRRGRHNSIHLQRAWNKYGSGAFVFEVIEHVNDVAQLIGREQVHLDANPSGYNIAPRAGHTLGAKRTAEQVERMAAKLRGRKLTPEHRSAIARGGMGRKHSPETIQKMREARLRNNHQVGRPLTDAQKKALFKSGSDHPWFGRTHTTETKLKISIAKRRVQDRAVVS